MQRLEKSCTICIIPNGPSILDMHSIYRTDCPRHRRHVVQVYHNRLLMRDRHIESADPQGDCPGYGRGKLVRCDRKRHIHTVQVLLPESKGMHHG